ncbi:protein translocase subunit SecE [Steroidobacter agaridevorans]|uniref:Protein translocase subunit SecE n=1 Tax=Steroidobacter agaridevorans TaxID=2695856 RepID=A0A829YP16_9GAMM|nr:preprotein translocase subunit SecE [Steroidobacter agaridevorans]GFE85010.1 protein translocase subunit SecE [Steroidobacter agaridevorans]GFE91930.1 protein translocase subunit SecE [Steroidobacter agaridevorans]
MTDQVQENATALDALKLAAGVVILAAGIAGFYLLVDLPIWLRWIIVLAALIAGALVSLQSYQGKTFWQFVQSSRVELRKVVWPSTQETWQVTLVVFVMILVLGLFFWGVDTLLGFLTKWLTGRGG